MPTINLQALAQRVLQAVGDAENPGRAGLGATTAHVRMASQLEAWSVLTNDTPSKAIIERGEDPEVFAERTFALLERVAVDDRCASIDVP